MSCWKPLPARRRSSGGALAGCGIGAGPAGSTPHAPSPAGKAGWRPWFRCCCWNPAALLLDEPFTRLGMPRGCSACVPMLARWRDRGGGLLLATHDPDLARGPCAPATGNWLRGALYGRPEFVAGQGLSRVLDNFCRSVQNLGGSATLRSMLRPCFAGSFRQKRRILNRPKGPAQPGVCSGTEGDGLPPGSRGLQGERCQGRSGAFWSSMTTRMPSRFSPTIWNWRGTRSCPPRTGPPACSCWPPIPWSW
jgi:hypothetical protein